jgi:competence protein ComEC
VQNVSSLYLASVCVYLVFSIGIFVRHSVSNDFLVLKVFDIGQGDAILLTTPKKKRILIDGGPSFEIDYYLHKELPLMQDCHLDVVILTHPHRDHLLGLNRVLQRCSVGRVFYNDVPYESGVYTRWRSIIEHHVAADAVSAKALTKGMSFVVDDVTFKVLWPTKVSLKGMSTNVNNHSIVLFIDYGDFEALLLGDAESKALRQLDVSSIASLIDNRLDVLKISHHGARNGLYKPLIHALAPRNFVISVGAKNKYGHPASDVVKFLESLKGSIYRTDNDHTVEFRYPRL